MIRRLTIIAGFTGSAYLFTVLCLKYLSSHTASATLKSVGEIDSLSNYIVTIIAAGLLMTAVRDIAVHDDWKRYYIRSQQARLTLSILVMLLGLIAFVNTNYLVFLFAPVFALNGDYALYGRSKAITASVLAFLKVFVPFAVIVLASVFFPEYMLPSFLISTVLLYALNGIFISRVLDVPYLVKPSARSLRDYVKSLPLGIVTLSYFFIGLGLIPVVSFFYDDASVAMAFLGIKLYTIFKGILRIINQSFLKEMVDDEVCLKVDQLASAAGFLFFAAVALFPDAFIGLLLGSASAEASEGLYLLGIAGIISSAFTSFTTKAILEKKDKAYAAWSGASILLSGLAAVGLSFTERSVQNIYLAVGVGELVCVIGLFAIISHKAAFAQRYRGILLFLPFLVLPVLSRYLFGDDIIAMIAGIGLSGILFLLTQYKKFSLPVEKLNNTQ